MKNNQKGFVGLVLIILIALAIGGGVAYMYDKNKNTDVNTKKQEDTTKTAEEKVNQSEGSPIGLWKLEKGYFFDASKKEFVEMPDQILYMEYTKDGKWCSRWEGDNSTKCNGYDTYTFDKNIIKQNQVGLTGPEWHYIWSIENGDLVLIAETYDDVSKKWSSESIKYVLKPIVR